MMGPVTLLTVVVLAVFVGFEVVSKVTSKLHTPLMSGANAIHGIILVGAIIVAGQASDPWVIGIALLAVVLATVNLVGGFVVTDRMLEMFSARKRAHKPALAGPAKGHRGPGGRHSGDGALGREQSGREHSGREHSGREPLDGEDSDGARAADRTGEAR
jgi:NAD(P) transhydrogenase subunit alpha